MSKRGMGDLSRQTAEEATEALQDQELQLLAETSGSWSRFKPQIADQETYAALIAGTGSATSHNEKIAALRATVKALGDRGAAVARRLLALVKAGC